MSKPLEGIRVIELANYVAAPIVGRILADMGAEVIKIEGPGSYPVNSRYAMGDTISGTTLFGGVMTALYQRERTGKGDFVTMSLYNAGIWNFSGSIVMAEKPYEHRYPEIRNMGIPMNLAYKCKDGEWIRCTLFEFDRYAYKFFDAIGVRNEMAELGITTLDLSMENADKLVPLFEPKFLEKTSEEWLKTFAELDIVCGRLNHFRDVLTDEQAWANDYLQKYECTNGAVRILPSCPVRLGSQGAFPLGKPVMYGADNQEILKGLGYADDEIAAMTEAGVFR